MPGTIEWIKYKNHEILFNNRSNLRGSQIIENVKEAVSIVKNSLKRDILYLVDNSNTIIIPEVKDYIKQAGKELAPYLKKTAVVGTSNAQKILLNVLSSLTGMSIKVFNDLESAKTWLVKG